MSMRADSIHKFKDNKNTKKNLICLFICAKLKFAATT